MTQQLTLADVVAIHGFMLERLCATPRPLRNEATLESAIMRPRAAAHYEDADAIAQAALLAIGISQAQAFLDGNKRAALLALDVFLALNDLAFTADPLDLARQLEAVAERPGERAAVEGDFEKWLRQRVAPLKVD